MSSLFKSETINIHFEVHFYKVLKWNRLECKRIRKYKTFETTTTNQLNHMQNCSFCIIFFLERLFLIWRFLSNNKRFFVVIRIYLDLVRALACLIMQSTTFSPILDQITWISIFDLQTILSLILDSRISNWFNFF